METPDTKVFERPASAVVVAYWQLAAAGGLVLFAIVNFLVALRINVSMVNLQLTTTAPMLGAIFLFSAAIRELRMPMSVRITPQALEIMRRSGAMLVLPWERIVLVKTASASMAGKKQLTLYDGGGKVLARLSENFNDFPAMETAIRARQEQSPRQTEVKRGQSRRKGVFFMVCGVLFTAVGVANAWIALNEHRDRELFEKLGQSTSATVVRQFIAPNGRTRRIEFRVDGVPNAPDVNVEVNPILWMAMTPHQRIRVIAVPGHPDIAHLPVGEIQDNSAPAFGVMLPLSMGICLFAVATFVVGILVFRGMQAKWI